MKSPYLNAGAGVAPPPPTTIEPCPFCDWQPIRANLAYQFVEHRADIKCPLSGRAYPLETWNRRPTPQPTREAPLAADGSPLIGVTQEQHDAAMQKFGELAHPPKPEPTAPAEGWMQPEQLAQQFHEIYERLAPQFSYETRKESAKPWNEIPEPNRKLMTNVCAEIIARYCHADALLYGEAALSAAQTVMTQRGDLKGAGLMQSALDKLRAAIPSKRAAAPKVGK